MCSTGKLLQYHVQDMNKWEMFTNYIFAKVTSFAEFCLTNISKYTVLYEHEAIRIPKSEHNIGAPSAEHTWFLCKLVTKIRQFCWSNLAGLAFPAIFHILKADLGCTVNFPYKH